MGSSFFGPRTLERFRAIADTARPHTAKRYAASEAYVDGETTVSYPGYPSAPTATFTRNARLDPKVPPAESEREDRIQTVIGWILALPVTADVAARDRWVVEGTDLEGVAWSRLLEVSGKPGPHTNEVERLIECLEIPSGS